MGKPATQTAPSGDHTIYIAGDPLRARQVCQAYCDEVGMCVSVVDTDYIFTGGCWTGVAVKFINYPRFPLLPSEWLVHAEALAERLREALGQFSYSIVGPTDTVWASHKEPS